jgi:hypothetical protein
MAQATDINTTNLSALFRDPVVRAAFERAERDNPALPVEPVRPTILTGGASERPTESPVRSARELVEA